ncbi:hypothetical protein chiPu_0031404, partial [Chiloscyllium punctatum]|nr:hypothetical protein [Chiloscyllium punctatum]
CPAAVERIGLAPPTCSPWGKAVAKRRLSRSRSGPEGEGSRGLSPPSLSLAMAAEFHLRTGKLVALLNGNRTAKRNKPTEEFNHGLAMSREPLGDGQLFQVRIDRKVSP